MTMTREKHIPWCLRGTQLWVWIVAVKFAFNFHERESGLPLCNALNIKVCSDLSNLNLIAKFNGQRSAMVSLISHKLNRLSD